MQKMSSPIQSSEETPTPKNHSIKWTLLVVIIILILALFGMAYKFIYSTIAVVVILLSIFFLRMGYINNGGCLLGGC